VQDLLAGRSAHTLKFLVVWCAHLDLSVLVLAERRRAASDRSYSESPSPPPSPPSPAELKARAAARAQGKPLCKALPAPSPGHIYCLSGFTHPRKWFLSNLMPVTMRLLWVTLHHAFDTSSLSC
jgi:hypothetical protein